MKKICFFVADITFKGGIERVLSNLATGLSKDNDLDITIVSQYHTFDKPNYPFPPNVNIKYLSDLRYDGRPKSTNRLIGHLKNLGRIRKFFKDNHFDIVSAQSFTNVFLLYCAGMDMSTVIAVEHVYWGYYGKIIQYIRKYIYRRCKEVVVLTNYDYKYYSTFLKNVFIIPNPIRPNFQKPEYKGSSKKIIAIGRLEDQKGFEELIDNFKNVADHYPEWHLDIYGEGNLKQCLEAKIVNKNLGQNVYLMGTTDDIGAELRKSSFLVMSSKFEGFGMVLLEAMNEGIPCISFDCPAGPSDILDDNKYGLLVRNQDFNSLIANICNFINSYDLRNKFSELAFKRVRYYSTDRIVGLWKRIF